MKVTPTGEQSILLSVSYESTAECVRAIDKLYRLVNGSSGVLSVRRGLDSLLVEYDREFDLVAVEKEAAQISEHSISNSGEQLRVPVCYDLEFARDLKDVTKQTGLNKDEIIKLHSSTTYEVWMIGFMPGYPYLGALPEALQVLRKSTPDLTIPAGSVAIADEFTGIYPFDSPGGWHVIGRTPWSIIDYSKSKPWLFDYGMRVQFYPIQRSEFAALRQ